MSRVYVGNLDSRVTERDLEDEFRAFGVLRSVWVARRPPGYGFVEFDDRRDALDAIRDLDEVAVHEGEDPLFVAAIHLVVDHLHIAAKILLTVTGVPTGIDAIVIHLALARTTAVHQHIVVKTLLMPMVATVLIPKEILQGWAEEPEQEQEQEQELEYTMCLINPTEIIYFNMTLTEQEHSWDVSPHCLRLSAFSSLSVFVLSGKSSTHDISLTVCLSAKWHGQQPWDLFHCLGFLLLSSHDLFLLSSTASPWDLPHLDFLLLFFSPSISHQDQ
ncbi:hypothetical protein C4D60_Mb07t11890 [Musa balbisiana]|uniref:RRM domain-containing protein n=1 Tax=Musa balbisiana TaxID=52838 RepID=A0A4S8JGL2_MUSBA|nr:hypothetical protein C4D60_Mb07t11890 [Musa balbisiana]